MGHAPCLQYIHHTSQCDAYRRSSWHTFLARLARFAHDGHSADLLKRVYVAESDVQLQNACMQCIQPSAPSLGMSSRSSVITARSCTPGISCCPIHDDVIGQQTRTRPQDASAPAYATTALSRAVARTLSKSAAYTNRILPLLQQDIVSKDSINKPQTRQSSSRKAPQT